jgi:hypothetical protein
MAHWLTLPNADEVKEKIRQANIGNSNALGYRHNEERKSKIKAARAKQTITPESRSKAKLKMTGDKHPLWKGEEVGYAALHTWVARHRGKPSECEHCGTDDASKIYEWANIDGEYNRCLDDFIRLCRSCHRKYDYHTLGTRSGFSKLTTEICK